MKYIVSGVRTTIGGQPWLRIVDDKDGATWAFVPFSDRTTEDFRNSYQDANAVAFGLNQKGCLAND